jgi:hypothetical protein
MTDERELMKEIGEQAWERGKMEGQIEGLILNYGYDDSVPQHVIEDLKRVLGE